MRPEKKLIIEDVKQQIDGSPFLLLTDYTGLTVQHFSDLRKRLGDAGAECHVVRNSMLSRAIEAAGLEKPNGALVGMTAMVIGSNEAEITAIAKILRDFAKDTERSSVKLGYMGQEKIDADQVKALAELPGKRTSCGRGWSACCRRRRGRSRWCWGRRPSRLPRCFARKPSSRAKTQRHRVGDCKFRGSRPDLVREPKQRRLPTKDRSRAHD